MSSSGKINLDDYSKGLLIGLISKAITKDKELTSDDIIKLKEIKLYLQNV